MTEIRSSTSETIVTDHPNGNVFDGTDDLELQQQLEKLEREITEITFENILFESVLERKKSEIIVEQVSSVAPTINSSQATIPTDANQDLTNTGTTNRSDRARKRSKSRSTQADFRIQLTLEQKLDIMISEYEQTKTEKLRCEITNEKKIDQLESDLEWIDVEITDFDLATTDFLKTKDASFDKRTHKYLGEKLEHYFKDHLKARDSLTNKLRDRSSGLKTQITRAEMQLKQKEEMGETLLEVDFNQLKIENKQYLDKIDEKNIELIFFKRQVGKVTHLLNYYKDELHARTEDLIDTQRLIDKQQNLYERTQQDILTVNYEQSRMSRKHYHLVEQIENYQAPEILDYVRNKALLYKLQRECEVWQRKVELVSMGLQQSKQEWQVLQQTAQYHSNIGN